MAKVGRPSIYTPEIVDAICERLTKGEPLARICDDDAMPGYSTIRQWEDQKPEFAALSARARELGCDYIADDCLRIADDLDKDKDASSRRVRIDTRIRLLGKWYAKRYGDKIQNQLSGPNGEPLPSSITVTLAAPKAHEDA